MNTLTVPQQDIALRAYHIYQDGGYANGRDLEHWFLAEKELGARYLNSPAAKALPSVVSAGTAKAVKAASAAKAAPVAKKAVKKATAKKAPEKKAAPKK